MRYIAIVGGIGSGKSVVSRIVELLGYPVYDCDSRAKLLMNSSTEIKSRLCDAFGSDVVGEDGLINKKRLAEIIFNDAEALGEVNSIVHPQVTKDILRCASQSKSELFFFETALPQESGLDKLADAIWLVEAPEELRIARVMARNGISREQVLDRLSKQDYSNLDNENVEIIGNDGALSVMTRVVNLLKNMK